MTEHAATRRGTATTSMAAALLSLFVALGFIAHHAAAGTTLDHAVLTWMLTHHNPALTALAIAVTNVGSPVGTGIIAVAAAAVLWWRRGSPRPAILILTTLGIAGAISTLSKTIVGAHRPAQAVQLVAETDPSFPSGHVTGTLALAGTLAVVISHHSRRTVSAAVIALAAAAIAAVALTRLYLGVHWVTDISGGLLLGGAAAVAAHVAYRRVMGPSDTGGNPDAPALSGAVPTIGA